jgi:hypothetical protein
MNNNNKFNFDYLEKILRYAKDRSYRIVTLKDFVRLGCPNNGFFILRLDLDLKPQTLRPFLRLIEKLDILATLFVRVTGPYNILWYPNYKLIQDIKNLDCEIGLHTSAVEWAKINEADPEEVLSAELNLLRSTFDVIGIAPHRDINYMYNTLPWLEDNWLKLSSSTQLDYHAYQAKIMNNVIYVNEGLSPHLGWRNQEPISAIDSGKSICMLLHPHWWYVDHAFESE